MLATVRIAVAALVVVFASAPQASAQALTNLYRFNGGTDGQNPMGALLQDNSGNLYGTTSAGGDLSCVGELSGMGCGTVFELSPPASPGGRWTKTTLYRFRGSSLGDGVYPIGALIFGTGGALYGVTEFGGTSKNCDSSAIQFGCGTVYRLAPPASPGRPWSETVLYSFQDSPPNYDGGEPIAGLVLDQSGAFYGTTVGGCCTDGTAFQLVPPAVAGGSWTLNTIYFFQRQTGAGPDSPLVMDGEGGFYGSAVYGGTGDGGVVFDLVPPTAPGAAWTETVLHNFGIPGAHDGTNPSGVILGASGSLIGNPLEGGVYGFGMIFQLLPPAQPGGIWTETGWNFRGGAGANFPYTPVLDPASGVLYGVSQFGGDGSSCTNPNGCGTAFALTPPSQPGSAWSETLLLPFRGNPGEYPFAPLILGNDGALYGTTNGLTDFSQGPFGTVIQLQP